MSKFIEVTYKGKKELLNVDLISHVGRSAIDESNADIGYDGVKYIIVDESYEEIKAMLMGEK